MCVLGQDWDLLKELYVTCGSCIQNSKDMAACDSVMLQLYHCLN